TSSFVLFYVILARPLNYSPFPYTTLFRSWRQQRDVRHGQAPRGDRAQRRVLHRAQAVPQRGLLHGPAVLGDGLPHHDVHPAVRRSEEHTSELQSRENLVCRLLLEKKTNKK